jgi:hypothetical protein
MEFFAIHRISVTILGCGCHWTVGMDQNFSKSIYSLIKFRISCRNVIESDLVRDDEGGFGASVHD